MPITARELRARYLAFFVERGHAAVPSASLVPANDPTVLFTTAGMHPLVPYLLGAPHPAGRRLANVQRCVRTGDIDAIGDDTHLTCFEMLGNWSLGDYARDDALRWSLEFLTDRRWLGLPLDRLAVSCFAGDERSPRDTASGQIWRALGVAAERIAWLGRDDNWWGPAGATGPCGPDSEIFYWIGDAPPRDFDPRDRRWVEIWNNVFMDTRQTDGGALEPLPRPNVDTGMGLERALVALNGFASVYEVDTLAPLLAELRAQSTSSGKSSSGSSSDRDLRILTDHVRAASFLIGDGVEPSNKDRGYVVRRLLRRCLWLARRLALPGDWYLRGLDRLAACLGDDYPSLIAERDAIERAIATERDKLDRAVNQGTRALRGLDRLDGALAFDLFQTHGIPFELTLELAEASGVAIDREAFDAARAQHRDQSRTASSRSGSFAGGLADHSAEVVRYHTLTHLLQAALRSVLGDRVVQRGSNLTRERLRFDFSHERKLSPDETAQVEALVNGWLARDLSIERITASEPEARAMGALGAFGEKYGEVVSVYTVRDRTTGEVISREICGGPHVAEPRTELAGQFRIVREQAVSAGIRRIRAVLG